MCTLHQRSLPPASWWVYSKDHEKRNSVLCHVFFPVFVIIFSLSKCRDVSLMKKGKMWFLGTVCISYNTIAFMLRWKRVSHWNRKLSLFLAVSTCTYNTLNLSWVSLSSFLHTVSPLQFPVHGTWGTSYPNEKRGMADIHIVRISSVHAPAPLSQWVALPQNEPCSEARAQPDTFDPSVGLQINPCCPSAEQNMHQLPTEPGAPRGWWLCAHSQGGECPAGPGLLAVRRTWISG